MIICEKEGNSFEITPNNSFGLDNETMFKEKITNILKNKPSNIFINLENIEYIDSTALGLMILAKKEANKQNCAITVITPKDENVMSILKMTKFDEIFTMRESN